MFNGPRRDAARRSEASEGMSDDVEATLAALEERLRSLEADLSAPPAARASEPARASTPADPLDQFGVELRRLATDLVEAWDRVVVAERAAARTRRQVVLEAQADLHALAALERALSAAPGVAGVELRAYAGGHASLVVDLS